MTWLLPNRPAAAPLDLHPTEPAVRPAEPDDLAELHRLYTQPHVARATSAPPFASRSQIEAWLRQIDGHGWLLVAVAGPAIVGAAALKTSGDPIRRHVGEIGWVAVDAGWQGRGIGSRLVAAVLELADGWLDLTRVELLARADNPAALVLYRKHGFVEEGRLRGYAFRDGAYVDAVAMARLRGPLARA